MLEFLEKLSVYCWENFPVWYPGYSLDELCGLDLMLCLISDYFTGDMVIEMNQSCDSPSSYDIEYRAWDYNRTGIREVV